MNAATPSTTTALWARLRAIFMRAFASAPAFIVCAILRVAIVSRLRMLETLTRKLLLAEALHQFEDTPPRVVNRSPRRPGRTKPRTRSTSFSLRLPRDRALMRQRTPRTANFWNATPPAYPSAAHIAQRIEALHCVLNDPAPFVRRLSRILARTRIDLKRIITRCALFGPRRYVADPNDPSLSRDVAATILAATYGFRDSS